MFDSVRLGGLKEAMKRIKFPPQLVHILIDLFDNREIKIIMKFSLTEGFRAKEE